MNILALSCSPRKNANTDLLLDEFLRELISQNTHSPAIVSPASTKNCTKNFPIEIKKIYIADKKIKPCNHCDYCQTSGYCNIKDDMTVLYDKLQSADCLVLASPIYFMAHCAQAKLLIDRCQVFWARKYILKQEPLPVSSPRLGIFIAAGATHGPKVFAGAKTTMKWFFDALNINYWANLLVEGVDDRGDIKKHNTAIQQAVALAKKLKKQFE